MNKKLKKLSFLEQLEAKKSTKNDCLWRLVSHKS